MGSQAERIGVAQACELCRMQSRQAFDVGALRGEIAQACEEFDQVFRTARHVGRLVARREDHAGDLAGTGGDGCAQSVLINDEGAFDCLSAVCIFRESDEHAFLHQVGGELRHHVAHRLDLTADRVRREEVAQDDPEPFHVGSME